MSAQWQTYSLGFGGLLMMNKLDLLMINAVGFRGYLWVDVNK
jgi:hypothetical protein